MRHLRAFIRGKWSLSYFLLQLFLPGLTWPLLRIVNASVAGNRVSPYIVSAALAGDPVPLQIVPPGHLDRNDFMNMRLLAVPMAVFLLASCGGGGGKSPPPLRISPAAPPTAADRTLPGERQTPPPGSEFADPPDRNSDADFDPNDPDPTFIPSLDPGPAPGNRPRPAPPTPPTGPERDPAHHLTTPRFTVHQPRVLEQIGAHHAYARGLTGRGVRIGIQDSIVDYTQTGEFGSRVLLRAADGAVLSYSRLFGDDPDSDIGRCRSAGTCRIYIRNSRGDGEARNRWVREIVNQDGWPATNDSIFVVGNCPGCWS